MRRFNNHYFYIKLHLKYTYRSILVLGTLLNIRQKAYKLLYMKNMQTITYIIKKHQVLLETPQESYKIQKALRHH